MLSELKNNSDMKDGKVKDELLRQRLVLNDLICAREVKFYVLGNYQGKR